MNQKFLRTFQVVNGGWKPVCDIVRDRMKNGGTSTIQRMQSWKSYIYYCRCYDSGTWCQRSTECWWYLYIILVLHECYLYEMLLRSYSTTTAPSVRPLPITALFITLEPSWPHVYEASKGIRIINVSTRVLTFDRALNRVVKVTLRAYTGDFSTFVPQQCLTLLFVFLYMFFPSSFNCHHLMRGSFSQYLYLFVSLHVCVYSLLLFPYNVYYDSQ